VLQRLREQLEGAWEEDIEGEATGYRNLATPRTTLHTSLFVCTHSPAHALCVAWK